MPINTAIQIRELNTPESRAMKYIAWMFGLNLRPGNAILDRSLGVYRVPINAIMPNRVLRKSGESKTFVFKFSDVGEIAFDTELNFKKASTAEEIDNEITTRFWSIYSAIEREILTAGRSKWGKLVWVRAFMRPMYSIVTHILTKGYENIDTFKNLDMWNYVRVLLEDKYLAYSPQNPDLLIPDNKLVMLHRITYAKDTEVHDSTEVHDLFEVANTVVGDMFSRRYTQLIQEFRLFAASAYVDLTKTYYVDAINIGERIAIPQEELFQKYTRYVNRPVREDREVSFATLVSELVAAQLLAREQEKITGDPTLFNQLLSYRDDILRGVEVL